MPTSREIIEASCDLKKLFDEGFELSIKHVHLLVSSVPYVTSNRAVARGTLVIPLELQDDFKAKTPSHHWCYFAGEYPCYPSGLQMTALVVNNEVRKLADGIVTNYQLSARPETPDPDYWIKVKRYIRLLGDPASDIEPDADARTRRIVEVEDEQSPLVFLDTNSARAQIMPISDKLKGQCIAIVGVGGTGSYVLDLLAKTPIKEIHLFDDDEFSLHNAYRAPGAPTAEQLRARMFKVDYLYETFRRMHKGIKVHRERVTAENLCKLDVASYVFLCMDPGPDKLALVEHLVASKVPFTDTGIGIQSADNRLLGVAKAITVTPDDQKFLPAVPVKPPGDNDLYASNIQIAEMNSIAAIFAVVRWKKYVGFYFDPRRELQCTYDVAANMLLNDETNS